MLPMPLRGAVKLATTQPDTMSDALSVTALNSMIGAGFVQ